MSTVVTHPILDSFQFEAGPPARHEQLFRFIHDAVASGSLSAGARLPPTRDVARQLKTSRQTVVVAYERLLAEGILEGRQGSGTFIAATAAPIARRDDQSRDESIGAPSGRSQLVTRELSTGNRLDLLPLRPGIPDLANFPHSVWSRLSARNGRSHNRGDLGYGDGAGLLELRESVAQFLRTYRGVPCAPEQVIITSGTQSSIFTTANVVADPGDCAVVENPGHRMTHVALMLSGLKLLPAKVDAAGVCVDPLRRTRKQPKLLVCTPSHQYPLGVTMSLERRLELLDWADRTNCLIVEDDYNSEFRYTGAPVPTLASLDHGRGRVIYAGTFSKLLAPGLRLGFVVVPEKFVDIFRSVRTVLDRHPSVVVQRICSEFISNGHLAAHIRKMKPLYASRRSALIESLEPLVDHGGELIGSHAGLHASILMKDSALEQRAAMVAEEMSLGCMALSSFAAPAATTHYWGLALGFAGTEADTIRELAAAYVKRLVKSMRSNARC